MLRRLPGQHRRARWHAPHHCSQGERRPRHLGAAHDGGQGRDRLRPLGGAPQGARCARHMASLLDARQRHRGDQLAGVRRDRHHGELPACAARPLRREPLLDGALGKALVGHGDCAAGRQLRAARPRPVPHRADGLVAGQARVLRQRRAHLVPRPQPRLDQLRLALRQAPLCAPQPRHRRERRRVRHAARRRLPAHLLDRLCLDRGATAPAALPTSSAVVQVRHARVHARGVGGGSGE